MIALFAVGGVVLLARCLGLVGGAAPGSEGARG